MFRHSKKGASRVTSEFLVKVGEIILPTLAFLVVLFIVITVGASRGPQTYFQTVEYSNIVDTLASFNGFASVRYIPIMDDFNISIVDNVMQVQTRDGKAPNQRSVHIPKFITLLNNLQLANQQPKTLQNRFVRTQTTLMADSFNAGPSILYNSLGTPNRPQFYYCPPIVQKTAAQLFISSSDDPQFHPADTTSLEDLKTRIVQRKITLAQNSKDAGIMLAFAARPAAFNSLVIFTDGSHAADAFACAFANALKTVDRAEIHNVAVGQYIDSIVLVPSRYRPTTAVQSPDASTPKVFIELSYIDNGGNSPESSYNAILSKSIASAYTAVSS